MGRRTRFISILGASLLLFFGACTGPLSGGLIPEGRGEITTVVIREKAGATSSNYPLSFGHVFKRGDVPSGSTVQVHLSGEILPSQFDVKSTYPDGSVRHGVVTVRIPRLMAFSDTTLGLVRTSRSQGGPWLDRDAILATDVGATIELLGQGLQADLRKAIMESAELDYWLRGELCTEILVRQNLNNQLNALWEVRFFPGTPYIRISHTIENVNIHARGNVHYALSIKQGNRNPAEVYTKGNFQHNHSARWRKVLWLGPEPPEVEIRFNLPYMISTGMILPYDTSLQINEGAIAASYSSYQASNKDIMGNGSIYRYMPGVGGRSDIGVLPTWTALYLLTMDNRMREITLGNGEMSGSIPIHYREDDTGLSFHGRTVSIDDRPNFVWMNYNGPAAIGPTDNEWHPDRAHQPSLAYIPYLITGEKWFLDELYYWAGYNVFFASYHRSGRGFNGTSYTNSFGLVEGDLRACAWALRTISEAAAIAPNGDLEKNYFRQKINNNLEWFLWRNNPATGGHGLHSFLWPSIGAGGASTSWPGGNITSPWQHDFMVLVLADMVRKLPDLSGAVTLRDMAGSFTINRFIELPPYAGIAYRMPLSDQSNNYYTDASWPRFAADVARYHNYVDPQIYFKEQDYAYSYAAIALGASAVVSHLPNGMKTYDFLRANLDYNTWARNNPTWAFAPVR